MGLSAKERQRRWRERQRASGVVNATLLVPAGAVPDLLLVAEALRQRPDLRPGPLRDWRTGRFVGIESIVGSRASAGASATCGAAAPSPGSAFGRAE